MAQYDYLIVGSGLFGAAFAYLAHKKGKKCLVLDRRSHLGGNIYCEKIGGINVHKYGAHIFHTNNKDVWSFVNSIVEFNRYTNSPVVRYKDKMFNLPFNMNTFHEMWPDVYTPEDAQRRIEEQKAEALSKMKADGVSEPRNLEEQAKVLIGEDIYHALIEGYTEKQWGRKCTELPSFIIKRLPVRLVFDNNYFNAKYQGIPMGGYNELIEGLLKGVETKVGVNYLKDRTELNALADKVVYTGALDEYFDYNEGKLQYRTVRFQTETLDKPNFQGNAVINTEREVPYTRIIEHKHFEMFGEEVYDCPKTVISREFSTEWNPGMEPYYPVNDAQNAALYVKYKERAKQMPNMIIGGRMADYAYYDMDIVVEKVMSLFG
ncbi:MAG TPA: UDP-galactopyranose mutase [Paludibacteraceae bacterium]|nr:UDP-galactopyranose mutase [Paludibacteraceae bacterium]HQF49707.1 UDP-galactopyranose mutase [Paludibacteraceae bacterium]